MSKQIEQLKGAMDRDLSNPRTLEIISQAHSEKSSLNLKPQAQPQMLFSDSEPLNKDITPKVY